MINETVAWKLLFSEVPTAARTLTNRIIAAIQRCQVFLLLFCITETNESSKLKLSGMLSTLSHFLPLRRGGGKRQESSSKAANAMESSKALNKVGNTFAHKGRDCIYNGKLFYYHSET